MRQQAIDWPRYPSVARLPAAHAFIASLAKRQRSPKTVDAYARNLEDMLRYFEGTECTCVLEADATALESYLAALATRPPKRRGARNVIAFPGARLTDNTIRQRLVSVRLFYDFCIHRGWRQDPRNPVPRGHPGHAGRPPERGPVPRSLRLPWTPPDDVWERLIRHVLTRESKRNAALIILAYDGALRREEVASLRLDDIDWVRRWIQVRAATSKSGRPRIVPISATAALVLKRYVSTDRQDIIDAFAGETDGPLFVSESHRNPGQPVRPGTFNDVIARLRRQLALPQLTPHTLRHHRCTILRRSGVDLDDIALFAGHASVATTRLYIHLAPTELSARIRAAGAPFDARLAQVIQEILHAPDTTGQPVS